MEPANLAEFLLLILELPYLLHNEDPDQAMMPFEHNETRSCHDKLKDPDDWNWKFPSFKRNTEEHGNQLCKSMIQVSADEWDTFIKRNKKSNNRGAFTGMREMQSKFRQIKLCDFTQHLLPELLKVLRVNKAVWVLNRHLDRDQAIVETMVTIQERVHNKTSLNNLVTNLVSEHRKEIGLNMLEKMDEHLDSKGWFKVTEYPTVDSAIGKIRTVLGHLGCNCKGSNETTLANLKKWHGDIPDNQTHLHDQFSWIGHLQLPGGDTKQAGRKTTGESKGQSATKKIKFGDLTQHDQDAFAGMENVVPAVAPEGATTTVAVAVAPEGATPAVADNNDDDQESVAPPAAQPAIAPNPGEWKTMLDVDFSEKDEANNEKLDNDSKKVISRSYNGPKRKKGSMWCTKPTTKAFGEWVDAMILKVKLLEVFVRAMIDDHQADVNVKEALKPENRRMKSVMAAIALGFIQGGLELEGLLPTSKEHKDLEKHITNSVSHWFPKHYHVGSFIQNLSFLMYMLNPDTVGSKFMCANYPKAIWVANNTMFCEEEQWVLTVILEDITGHQVDH